MKKRLFTLLSVSGLVLIGCGQGDQQAEPEEVATEERAAGEEETGPVESTDGVLEADVFTLEVKDSTVIQNPLEDRSGVYLTFDLTNNSDEVLTPIDITRHNITVHQDTGDGLFYGSIYHRDESFADSDEDYAVLVDQFTSMAADLEPGETVEVYQAYSLHSLDDPITITAIGLEDRVDHSYYEMEIDSSIRIQ